MISPAGPASWIGGGWRSEWRTCWEGASAGEENIRAPQDAVFCDELPIRLRTIDFENARNPFEIQLAPTIIRSKKDDVKLTPASVSWSRAGREVVVKVTAGKLTDEFFLEGEPPHRLCAWRMGDGGKLTPRRSLKIGCWNYHQPGDLDRALSAPGP